MKGLILRENVDTDVRLYRRHLYPSESLRIRENFDTDVRLYR